MSRHLTAWVAVPALAGALLFAGCDRERAARRSAPPGGGRPDMTPQLPLVAGAGAPRALPPNPLEGDEQALAAGRRLYQWMNCSGCHFEGGGGIGPPLMDKGWIYGGEPAQIFDSIAAGRANGMPVFGDKLTNEQIWQLVLYVQSLSAEEDDQERDRGAKERTQ